MKLLGSMLTKSHQLEGIGISQIQARPGGQVVRPPISSPTYRRTGVGEYRTYIAISPRLQRESLARIYGSGILLRRRFHYSGTRHWFGPADAQCEDKKVHLHDVPNSQYSTTERIRERITAPPRPPLGQSLPVQRGSEAATGIGFAAPFK